MKTPKHNTITVKLTGRDGNAFSIMAAVAKAMRESDVSREEIDEYMSAAMSGDYDNLLMVTMATVNVE